MLYGEEFFREKIVPTFLSSTQKMEVAARAHGFFELANHMQELHRLLNEPELSQHMWRARILPKATHEIITQQMIELDLIRLRN